MPAPSNPKRASSTSYAMPNWNPRRTSTYGQISAETNKSVSSGVPTALHQTKRQSAYHPLHPRHRNQSFKARVSRLCPSFVLSPRGDHPSSSQQWQQQQYYQQQQDSSQGQQVPVDSNGSVNPRQAFMARDFGAPACQAIFSSIKDKRIKPDHERDRNRANHWGTMTKDRTWAMQMAWKAKLKTILPNWKEHSRSWIGKGVLLTAFKDEGGQDTVELALIQIKLIRSMSQIPIELWFESAEDVSDEVEEVATMWNAEIRYFDDRLDDFCDSRCVEVSDATEPIPGLVNPAIRFADIERIRHNPYNTYSIKSLTIAAMINCGFEEFIYYSPAALPMQPPQDVFLEKAYLSTGAVFWQDPSSVPAYDSPIWPIIQSDCITTSFEQSWTVMAFNHQKSWKGLFLAWLWLTGEDARLYQQIFGKEGRDLMRMAWVATRRQYAIVDRMPTVALEDMSRIKGDGIACNIDTTIYPAISSDVLTMKPSEFSKEQKRQARLSAKKKMAIPNRNIFVLDTASNSLIGSGGGEIHIHEALDQELGWARDASQHVFTDAYAAGSDDRVCIQIGRRKAGQPANE
ncbi:hypothetical protein BGW42_000876 [Actinomortierella wolfii]|nr:hypothetical protein BGW42_000876 [Actinomortierella wolfii]